MLWFKCNVIVFFIIIAPICSINLLIVPGLGRSDRLLTVIGNLKKLEKYLQKDWECVIYIYALRNVTEFWSKKVELDYIYNKCRVVENPNKRITENLFMVQPALLKYSHKLVFILFDDIKLIGKGAFQLDKILNLMKFNNLTIASPMVY
jgi:hypothetical protein